MAGETPSPRRDVVLGGAVSSPPPSCWLDRGNKGEVKGRRRIGGYFAVLGLACLLGEGSMKGRGHAEPQSFLVSKWAVVPRGLAGVSNGKSMPGGERLTRRTRKQRV